MIIPTVTMVVVQIIIPGYLDVNVVGTTGDNYCPYMVIFNYGCCQVLVYNNVYTKKQLYWKITNRKMCKSIYSSIKCYISCSS